MDGVEHLRIRANGADLHVARCGTGAPLLLLHGWPEFWLTWEPVMMRLADRHTLIAPDLRGFGAATSHPVPSGPPIMPPTWRHSSMRSGSRGPASSATMSAGR